MSTSAAIAMKVIRIAIHTLRRIGRKPTTPESFLRPGFNEWLKIAGERFGYGVSPCSHSSRMFNNSQAEKNARLLCSLARVETPKWRNEVKTR
jgi:hypothetical protein